MSDDLTPPDVTPDVEAASAALDGDASAVARADAGLVEAMRAVRTELADVTPPSDAVREAAIRAALAAYSLPAEGTGTSGAGVPAAVSLDVEREARRRQRRTFRIAGALAAAAVVAIIGVAAVVSRPDDSGSGATSSKAADQAATTNAALSAAAPAEASTAAGGATATTAASATTTASATGTVNPSAAAGASTTAPGFPLNGPADVVPQIADGAGLRAYVASGILAPTPAAATGEYGTGGGAASTVAAGASTTVPPPAATAPRSGSGSATGSSTCDLGGAVFLGKIIYAGHPALAVRIVSTGSLRAIDATSCAILVEVAA